MSSISPPTALQGANSRQSAARQQPALLLGAGGWLGAAMLAQLLVSGGFSPVGAWATRAMGSSHRAVKGVKLEALGQDWAGGTAFIVLERQGLTGARDAVFGAPKVEDLVRLAQQLHSAGLSRLVVVLPHLPGSLPDALRYGFVDGTEQALSMLGFEQLLLVRSSRDALAMPEGTPWIERLAAGWWSQLRWMLPGEQKPLRSVALARVVVQAAGLMAESTRSVLILPQELASQAAQAREGIEQYLRAALTIRA